MKRDPVEHPAAPEASDPAPEAESSLTRLQRATVFGMRGRLPLIGHWPVGRQLRLLGALFLAAITAIVVLTALEQEAGHRAASRLAGVGRLQTDTQRGLAALQRLSAGDEEAIAELKAVGERLGKSLEQIGEAPADDALPATDKPGRQDSPAQIWQRLEENLERVTSKGRPLEELGRLGGRLAAASGGTAITPDTLGREQILNLGVATLSQRLGRAISPLQPTTDVAQLQTLGQDAGHLADALAAQARTARDKTLREGREALVRDLFTPLVTLLSQPKGIAETLRAAHGLQRDFGQLGQAADALATRLAQRLEGQRSNTGIITVLALAATTLLLLMAKAFMEDQHARREEAERLRAEAEKGRAATQAAILRLIDEMGDLASGDLRVRATVTDDVTGVIADAVNFAAEELAILARRTLEAAQRVGEATQTARLTSSELIQASETQSREILESGGAVLDMAHTMHAISTQATESSHVARQSLDAATHGAQAVSNAIRGMNDIRHLIQETGKRIKRLGESSQEISEIVELISDITEQTNVLALNAAIQAASAGPAGRGFSVVAEEVQRLAERSAGATRQIAGLVRAIQSDTQDAMSAMERSTRQVVEGTRLSDAAGRALREISSVSAQLAELIDQIASSTEQQAAQANQVADTMRHVLQIAVQTNQGSGETAAALEALESFARELRGSVSGFRI